MTKYTEEEKVTNRERYELSRTGDLTSYAALIGESFQHRVNLLAHVIKDVHEPSLGRYKERLLMKTISEFLPTRFSVASGFVLFPTEQQLAKSVTPGFDHLNKAEHNVSKQCDIIVYDSNDYPTIFKDDDFVVVRPESVRAIVEVKGALRPAEITSALDHFLDFGAKWRDCNEFYVKRGERALPEPGLFLMGWQPAVNKDGTPHTDGERLRKLIAGKYKKLPKKSLHRLPVLRSAYIYNDCSVEDIYNFDVSPPAYGFMTMNGKFIRKNKAGKFVEKGDRTVAALLAGVHTATNASFNRFLAARSDTARLDICPHKHFGFDKWLSGDEMDLLGRKARQKRICQSKKSSRPSRQSEATRQARSDASYRDP